MKWDTKMQILEQLFEHDDNSEDESEIDVKNNININLNNQGLSQPPIIPSLIQPKYPGAITAQQPALAPHNGTIIQYKLPN